MNDPTVTLDVREDIRNGNDPFTRIMKTVAGLQPGDRLLLYAPFEPVPLLHVMASKGFSHQLQPMANGDWQVLFERHGQPTAPAQTAQSHAPSPCGCSAVPVIEVDARGLEPPEPMMKILEALATLPAGAQLNALTERRPMHLYAHLEYRGFVGNSEEQHDGSYITHIRRG